MIEARELRIGNLCNIPVVRLNDLNIIEVLGQTIVKVDADFIKMVAERRIDFSPILITTKWLQQLGLQKEFIHSRPMFSLPGSGYLCIVMDKPDAFSLYRIIFQDGYIEEDYIRNVKYIHEVQNIYFALAEKELILNLHAENAE